MLLRHSLALMLPLFLAACVTVGEPIQTGPGTYMIGTGARGGLSSDNDLLAQSIAKAGQFCTAKGETLKVDQTSTSGTQGWTPQSNQVSFHCLTAEQANRLVAKAGQ